MRKVICDECKNEEETRYSSSNPTGWCDLKISGNIVPKGETYVTRINFEVMLCDVCMTKKFNFEKEAPKPIRDQFEEIAAQYLQDLCYDAAQEAVGNV